LRLNLPRNHDWEEHGKIKNAERSPAEVRFPDGRPSKYFYFENLPGRRLRSDQVERAVAAQEARRFTREEQNKLDSQ